MPLTLWKCILPRRCRGKPRPLLTPTSTLSGLTVPSHCYVQQSRKSCQSFTFLIFTHTVTPLPPCSPPCLTPTCPGQAFIDRAFTHTHLYITYRHQPLTSLAYPGLIVTYFPVTYPFFLCLVAELELGEIQPGILTLLAV